MEPHAFNRPEPGDGYTNWILVAGILVGIGAIPLLVQLSVLAGWYWVIGLATGLLVEGAGLIYVFRSERSDRARARAAELKQVLVDQALRDRSIRVTMDREHTLDPTTLQPGSGDRQSGKTRNGTHLILLGIFILVPALTGMLLSMAGLGDGSRVAVTLGTPALMLWAARAGADFYDYWQHAKAGKKEILGMTGSGIQVLAAVVIWTSLGNPGELPWDLFWFGIGAVLGILSAVLGTVMALRARLRQRKTGLNTGDEAALSAIEPESQPPAAGSISGAGVPAPRMVQASGQTDQLPGLFQIFVGRDRQYYFRMRAADGEILLVSEGYTSAAGCRNGVRSVKANAPFPERYDCRQAADGQFYFVIKAANYRIIARSRWNATRPGCEADMAAVSTAAPRAGVEEDLGENPGSPWNNNSIDAEGGGIK